MAYFGPGDHDVTTKLTDTQEAIVRECDAVKNLLIAKNVKYGNSASQPLNVFGVSSTTSIEKISVRCDDKLSRIRSMGGLVKVLKDAKNAEEDTVIDLIGYLILARVVHAEKEKLQGTYPRPELRPRETNVVLLNEQNSETQ